MIVAEEWFRTLKDGGFGRKPRNRRVMLGPAGYLGARALADGAGTAGRTRCNSRRSNNSHCTCSPGSKPIAAAKARGKLT